MRVKCEMDQRVELDFATPKISKPVWHHSGRMNE